MQMIGLLAIMRWVMLSENKQQKFAIITSYSEKQFFPLGKNFIDDFFRYFPNNTLLVVYVEGENTQKYLDINYPGWESRIDIFYLYKDCAKYKAFHNKYHRDPIYHGKRQMQGRHWKSKAVRIGYNFRFDAVRFAIKPFVIDHCLVNLDTPFEALFWFDVDVFFYEKLPNHYAYILLPFPYVFSYLNRKRTYSECGFLGFNVQSGRVRNMVNDIATLYACGDFIAHREWHDSYLWDFVRKKHHPEAYALPSRMNHNPWISSPLAQWCIHLKGDRKDLYFNEVLSHRKKLAEKIIRGR